MKNIVVYIHGKGGSAKEAEHYKPLFPNDEVVGFDYVSETPWDAKIEFSDWFDKHLSKFDSVVLIANSIGAYFAMNALSEKGISKAFFISPVVDMEKLISDMMALAGVDEAELESKKEIPTSFGETLSWDYLCYVRRHPILWNVPTCVLYGEHDNLTSLSAITEFSTARHASLTVMPGGEHWFHTDKEMRFLDEWIKNASQSFPTNIR